MFTPYALIGLIHRQSVHPNWLTPLGRQRPFYRTTFDQSDWPVSSRIDPASFFSRGHSCPGVPGRFLSIQSTTM
jgi:hypothetical protein